MVGHDLLRRGVKKLDEHRTAKQLIVGVKNNYAAGTSFVSD